MHSPIQILKKYSQAVKAALGHKGEVAAKEGILIDNRIVIILCLYFLYFLLYYLLLLLFLIIWFILYLERFSDRILVDVQEVKVLQ